MKIQIPRFISDTFQVFLEVIVYILNLIGVLSMFTLYDFVLDDNLALYLFYLYCASVFVSTMTISKFYSFTVLHQEAHLLSIRKFRSLFLKYLAYHELW